MAGAPVNRGRTPLKSYPTPFTTDVLFYEIVKGDLPKNAKCLYGQRHENVTRWPNHQLVAITPGRDGSDQLWWYAAEREHQDEYNFEFISGSPDFKFDTISRLYVIKRDKFEETAPAFGSPNPNIPEGRWRDGYVLFQKKQVRSEVPELDSLYVFERRIYVRRVTITRVELDIQTGRSKDSVTTIYHRGENVSPGVTIDSLVDDPSSPARGLQPDGTFREVEQLSENFFAVSVSRVFGSGTVTPPDGENPGTINPPTSEVVERPVPKVDDYIVHFRAAFLEIPYGTPHPTREGFFLTYIKPADQTGQLYDYFYAKSFLDQDAYNFEVSQNDVLTRAYIVPRGDYLLGVALPPLATGQLVPRDEDIPSGESRAPLFSQHGYTHEYVSRADKELDSFFIVIIRVFQKIEKYSRALDPDLDRYVETYEKITSKDPDIMEQPAEGPGRIVERDQSHTQYDLWRVRSIVPKAGEGSIGNLILPIQLPTIIGDANYDFVPYLQEVRFDTAWAWAASAAPLAFDQDFAVTFKMKEPSPGPYMTRTLRFLTDNPEAIQALYPLSRRAVPQREMIMVGSSYAIANDAGNQARAEIQNIEVPPSIHPEIVLTEPDGPAINIWTERLEATDGYTEYASQGILTVGARSLQTDMGLFIVEIIQLNAGGAYNGESYEWGSGSIASSTGGQVVLTPPTVSTAAPTSDNRAVIGSATPGAVMRVYSGAGVNLKEEGRGLSQADGSYEVALSTQYLDPQQLYITSRKNGLLSSPVGFITNDLAPLAPAASLNPAGLHTLTGTAQPGATLTIALDPVQQAMKVVVSGTATADTTIKVTIGAAILGASSPMQRVVNIPDTSVDSVIANLIRDALLASASSINAAFTIDTSGAELELEWKQAAPHDGSAYIEIEGADGIADASSTTVAFGKGSVTMTVPANGEFTYIFSPALIDGEVITLTVSDAGGVSPSLILVADALAPAAPDPVRFPTVALDGAAAYDEIIGTSASGSTVVATLDGVVKGSAVVEPDDSFVIPLDGPYVSGEVFRVHAHITGSETKRSPAVSVTAYDLALPKIAFTETEDLLIGTLPEEALALVGSIDDIKVVVRPEADTGSEIEVDIFTTREWQLSIMDLFELPSQPKAGQRYELFYRFPQADAPITVKAFPNVPLPSPSFAWVAPGVFRISGSTQIANNSNVTSTAFPQFIKTLRETLGTGVVVTSELPTIGYWPGGAVGPNGVGYATIGPTNILLAARAPWMGPGTQVQIRFPGSTKAPINITWETAPLVEKVQFKTNGAPGSWNLPADRPAELEEYSTIPVAYSTDTPTEPGADIYHQLIPPIMTIRVISPDGREIESSLNRVTKPPFS